ncbi:MAG: SxtJ family membrane protein [Ignavibacteria bacterium]|nr:SxtJ family membrane protein [Ignavibacteria bacterium]
MIIEEIKNIDNSKPALKKFGITIGIVLFVIAGLLFYNNNSVYIYWGIASLILIASGLIFPILLKPLNFIWMSFAVVLGFFMTRVILGILFYIIITPIGLIAKLFGKDFIDKRISKEKVSYWNYREQKEFSKEIYERQF